MTLEEFAALFKKSRMSQFDYEAEENGWKHIRNGKPKNLFACSRLR